MASGLQILGAFGEALPQAITLYSNIERLQEEARANRAREEYNQGMLGEAKIRTEFDRQRLDMERQSKIAADTTRKLQDEKLNKELQDSERQRQALTMPRSLISIPAFSSMPDEVKQVVAEDMVKLNLAQKTPTGDFQTNLENYAVFDKMMRQNTESLMKYYAPGLLVLKGEVEKVGKSIADAKLMGNKDDEWLKKEQDKFDTLATQYNARLNAFNNKAIELQKKEEQAKMGREDYLALPKTDPRRQSFIEGEQQLRNPEKPPSLGNAVETAIVWKFGNTDYLTKPDKRAIAEKWLGTPEGVEFTKRAAETLTPPSYTFPATSEGISRGITRGPGAGTVEPVGVGKPIPPSEVTKIGDLNAVLKNIDETKKLYNPEWVGPVSGRVGTAREKYTGGAETDQVKFYSYVRDMKDALLRARSGAQINEQEYERLVKFLPDEYLPAKSFKARLERFEEEVKIVLESKRNALKEGGYGSMKQGEKKRKPLSAFEE